MSITAQQMPQLGETMEVSIVNVDVVVTDKSGNRVHGLTKNDFEILENGKRQAISNFSEYASGVERSAAAAGGEGQEAPRRQPRTVVLFVERMPLRPQQADAFFGAIREFLENAAQPGDRVTLVDWSPANAEHIELAGDVASIGPRLEELSKAAQQPQPDAVESTRQETIRLVHAEERAQNLMRQGSAHSEFGGRGAGNGNKRTMTIAKMEEAIDGMSPTVLPMLTAFNEMQRRVHAINSTIASMGAGEGRKILLLATRRFGEVAGAEYEYVTGRTHLQNEVRNQFGTERLTKSVIANANANGVSIYPLYVPGLAITLNDTSNEDPMPFPAENYVLQNESSNLNRVADRTGGVAAFAVKDIVALLPQISSDASDYYSLAYRVNEKREDRERNLTVRVKNPDLHVRSRSAFVEKSDETRMRDRITAALFTEPIDSAIKLTAQAGARTQSGKTSVVPVEVRIPIIGLTAIPQNGKYVGAFSVYVGSAADLDEVSEITHKTQPFEFKESDLQKASAGYFTYTVDVQVNAKTKTVAVGVLDEVSKAVGLARLNVAR
ncbi:MAG TPA: VWA domain-containing protein [Thermoanaerobaculia bacterium]|nr:VWA domain-containing protein [Thermoanaerobaculia bacterium]